MKTRLFLKKINTFWQTYNISCNMLLTVCVQCLEKNPTNPKIRKRSNISPTFGKAWAVFLAHSWKVYGNAVQFLSAPGQHLSHYKTGPSVHTEDMQEVVPEK